MQRVSNGYTIIEVIIVLAVSSFILLASLFFFSGRQGQASFAQSMRDMQSKMQDWINDVPTGFAGGTSGTNTGDTQCSSVSGNPVTISKLAAPNPNDGSCIFLGKAIQFTDGPDNNMVYAYSVFGKRSFIDSDGNEQLVASLSDAQPVPAVGALGTGDVDLTDTHTLNGAHVKSICDGDPCNGNSHMAGFYLSLNTDQAFGENGDSNLRAFQYPLKDESQASSEVVNCIEMINPPGYCKSRNKQPDPDPLTNWQICFDNNYNDTRALLTIRSNNGFGVSTQLKFTPC
jgi:prepilin-type N-terminal cleavage/methylation domain-containing protein